MATVTYIKASTGIVKRVVENVVWFKAATDDVGNALNVVVTEGISSFTLVGKDVIGVNRSNVELMPSDTFPTPEEYSWNKETGILTFANDIENGERIKITYI